jgi:hypothetical protein
MPFSAVRILDTPTRTSHCRHDWLLAAFSDPSRWRGRSGQGVLDRTHRIWFASAPGSISFSPHLRHLHIMSVTLRSSRD